MTIDKPKWKFYVGVIPYMCLVALYLSTQYISHFARYAMYEVKRWRYDGL